MANEQIFSGKANEYAASRPSYAAEAVERIFSAMIREGESAADVGSGTGILSKEFLLRGYDVYCVEPNEAMREKAEAAYGGDVHFHSVAAAAENTGLPVGSVQLVTVASAFHWFDADAFYTECERILAPGGVVCILANKRVYDDFTKAQHAVCEEFCTGFTALTHGVDKMLRRADAFFKGEYHKEAFDFPLHYTKQSFIARSISSSYAPEADTAEYEGYVRALEALVDAHFDGGDVTIANETVVLWGRLRG